MVRVTLIEKVTFKQRPEGGQGVSYIGRERALQAEKKMFQGRRIQVYSRSIKEAKVAEKERGKVMGNGDSKLTGARSQRFFQTTVRTFFGFSSE